MRLSKLFMPTLRDDPAEADVVSHKLMLRAGMLRKVASGIYEYLPLGKRVLAKVENIVREEMDRAGAQEVLMPALQPAEVWQESGRWFEYGPEMMRLKDRHDREFCLGPTHEELITMMVKNDVRSYKRLPLTLYQIQVKFRDEIRPRFGLMRGREFLMKDAYSFDIDAAGMQKSYEVMVGAYCRIMDRCGLKYRAVEAESGLIGGDVSSEFMVLADSGEDAVVVCQECDFAANIEAATYKSTGVLATTGAGDLEAVKTPGMKSVAEVSKFLAVDPAVVVKTLIYSADDEVVAVLIPGDRELNENRLAQTIGVQKLFMPAEKDFGAFAGLIAGFVGPVGLKGHRVIADSRVRSMVNMIVGGNEQDIHLKNVNYGRDFAVDVWADLTFVKEGDACARCDNGRLEITRGIEVGHVFQLGTKYSEALDATFLDDQGLARPYVMGCYGIGVSRMAAAAIEQNYDERGIIWPMSIAPYEAVVLPLKWSSIEERDTAESIYGQLKELGIETLIDDRDESPGVKFADAELTGIPLQIIIGSRSLKEGLIEVKDRSTGETEKFALTEVVGHVAEKINDQR